VLQALYFVSLILIPWETVDEHGHHALAHLSVLNPLAAIVQQARHAIIDPVASHSAAYAAGGWERLLIPGGIVLAVFVLGYVVFDRAAPRIAEEL
jgi:ABC-2 type transport system permease protein